MWVGFHNICSFYKHTSCQEKEKKEKEAKSSEEVSSLLPQGWWWGVRIKYGQVLS